MQASMRVEASLDALSEIRSFVGRFGDEAGLDRRAVYRLRLAVDEIASNIVIRGHPASSGAPAVIDVEATISPGELTIVLEDEGPAFDPLGREAPDASALAAPIQERPVGGLGVFLAIRGVDEFRYERRDGLNRNVFVVHRRADPDSSR
jgi:anti-sigma regulatory factor (Ser/Thr protein kinase)